MKISKEERKGKQTLKAKVIKIIEDKDDNLYKTTITIGTPIGEFTGSAIYNPEHDDTPYSPITGGIIAESRAYIKYLDVLLKDRESQLKGLRRLRYAMPENKDGYIYVRRLEAAIFKEWLDFFEARSGLSGKIQDIYKSKQMVKNSLDKDLREQRKQIHKDLQEELSKLKETLNEQDKND